MASRWLLPASPLYLPALPPLTMDQFRLLEYAEKLVFLKKRGLKKG